MSLGNKLDMKKMRNCLGIQTRARKNKKENNNK